ncbi:hypothetical protein DFH09DRAFT_1136155 [Mycena vulgaris]|nr:hypothetical protein DFH09DRAFT_1136155 [Mycena vulgaris]
MHLDAPAPALPMGDARGSGDHSTAPGVYSPGLSMPATRLSPSPHAPHQPPSRLLTLPPELLTLIALHLATRPPNIGPPTALLPLLATCRLLHARLAYRFDAGDGNVGLWARIGRAKFSDCSSSSFLDSDDAGSKTGLGKGTAQRAAHALRARCLVLRTLRAGDAHAPGAGRALLGAYAMLVADSWPPPPLATTELPPLPDVLLPPAGVRVREGEGDDVCMEGGRGKQDKNRKQLAWAGARGFALRWVRERLWEGRFGEEGREMREHEHEAEQEQDAEEGNEEKDEKERDPWAVGWPRDREAGAAALWVIWFFEGWGARPPFFPALRCVAPGVAPPSRVFIPSSHPATHTLFTIPRFTRPPANHRDPARGAGRRTPRGHGAPPPVRRRAISLPLNPLPPAPLLRPAPPLRAFLHGQGGGDHGADGARGVSDLSAARPSRRRRSS